MQTTLSQVEKSEILNKRSNILCRVKKNTDIYLHPNSKNISNDKITQEIIFNTEVKQIDYYWVLSISPKTDYVIHLKRIQAHVLSRTIIQFYLRHGRQT